jgi:hypothetical protein
LAGSSIINIGLGATEVPASNIGVPRRLSSSCHHHCVLLVHISAYPPRDVAIPSPSPSPLLMQVPLQAALISHQPSIASQYYAAAALPPYRSPAACLALANLLLRGSGLAPSDIQSDIQTQDKGKGKARANSVVASPISPIVFTRRTSKDSATSVHAQPVAVPVRTAAQRIFGFWRGSTSPPSISEEAPSASAILSPTSPSDRRGYDLVATGWARPREGKRAVRMSREWA